jgi:hypothetical protein
LDGVFWVACSRHLFPNPFSRGDTSSHGRLVWLQPPHREEAPPLSWAVARRTTHPPVRSPPSTSRLTTMGPWPCAAPYPFRSPSAYHPEAMAAAWLKSCKELERLLQQFGALKSHLECMFSYG